MGLSHELISQFAKIVNSDKKQSTETTIYGTVVDQHGHRPGDVDANGNVIVIDENGGKYIKPDGSDQLIPITENIDDIVQGSTTTNTNYGDRASVLIKDHTATVTGNISSPATNNKEVETKITEFDIAVGEQIQANKGYFTELMADKANIGNLVAAIISVAELIAKDAEIENLVAEKASITDLIAKKIDTDVVIADEGIIEHLKAGTIDVLSLIADKAVMEELIANNANLNSLDAQKAYLKYAMIDFSNIGEAAITKLFADSGIIRDLVVSEGKITGELIGVTIKGDLVEAGTLKADRLVVKGSDGNYYALNTDFTAIPGVTPVEEDAIHGSVLIKESVTAEKIYVEDLYAFGATIGGFTIRGVEGDIPGAIYSSNKESIDSPFGGIYLDSEGQISFGDDENNITYRKDATGAYKLSILASDILFGAGKKFRLNNQGMTIEGSNDDNNTIKTVISNDGTTVYGNGEEMLKANDKGVVAKDLHAKTYLIVGNESRFETYINAGEKRTGCFWIGE